MMFIDDLREATDRVAVLNAIGPIACPPAADALATMSQAGRLVRHAQALQAALAAHFTSLGAFRADGAASTAAWLRDAGRLSGRTAKLVADAARAATAVPAIGHAMRAGHLSVEHAAALANLADAVAAATVEPDVIAPLLAAATSDTPDAFRDRVRAAAIAAQPDGGNAEAGRHRANSEVREYTADDAMGIIRAAFDAERKAIVLNGIDSIVNEQWRGGHPADSSRPTTRELPRLRADALVEMARRSLNGARDSKGTGTRRGEPMVVVHIDHRTLLDGFLREFGVCHLDDGTPIPAETARRIACEAGIIPIVFGGASEPLDVGRAQRLATAAQRTALRVRSSTCEFAGCRTTAAWCKAHHLTWWEHGGPTDLENLCLVCENHHHLVHEGGWRMERLGGVTYTRRPNGTYRGLAPPGRSGGDTSCRIVRARASRGSRSPISASP